MPRIPSRLTVIVAPSLVLGILAGYFYGSIVGFSVANQQQQIPSGSIPCKSGPWGDLSYTPFAISAPDDLLPVRALESRGTHWFFKGYTAENVVSLLQTTSLSLEQQRAFLDPSVFHTHNDGIELAPSADMVFSLPEDARGKLFQILIQFPENHSDIDVIEQRSLDERFSAGGVSAESAALFKRLCYQRGDFLLYSGLSALLGRLPTYEEKLRFVKALTREHTMLLDLHITPKTDINALLEYWGKGSWNSDVRTVLQSLAAIPTGTWMNIFIILPALPTSEIYTYPNPGDNPLTGPPVNRDCAWSSLNFFRNVPDPDFGTTDGAMRELKENYSPVPGDPRYGDVVLFTRPDGSIVHAAVYIADDICFTKNGGAVTHPWMLASVPDLLRHYSSDVNPDQTLTVGYYRNKQL